MSILLLASSLAATGVDIVASGLSASVSDFLMPPASQERAGIRMYLDGIAHLVLLTTLSVEFSLFFRQLTSLTGLTNGFSKGAGALAVVLPLLLSGHARTKLKKIQMSVNAFVGGLEDTGISPSGKVRVRQKV